MSGEPSHKTRLVENQVSRLRPALHDMIEDLERNMGNELVRQRMEHESEVRGLHARIEALQLQLDDANSKIVDMHQKVHDAEKKTSDMKRELEGAKTRWTGMVTNGWSETASERERYKRKLEKAEQELMLVKMQSKAARKMMKKATYILKDKDGDLPHFSSRSFEGSLREWKDFRQEATEETRPPQSLQFSAKWSYLAENVYRDEESETAVSSEDQHVPGSDEPSASATELPISPKGRGCDRDGENANTIPTTTRNRPTFPSLFPTSTIRRLLDRPRILRTRGSPAQAYTFDNSKMAPKTYTWVSLWFLITFPVIFWDVTYCFMRPRSFEGGDLHWYWSPYKLYQNIDLVYGVEAYKRGDGFANAQSLLNVVENLLNGLYLYTAHVTAWPPATLIGFTSASLTLAKTILYWAQEYYCNYCAVGHNDLKTLITLWVIPNGLWIVVPSLVVYRLGSDLVAQLNYADRAAKLAKLQKAK
ncbi:hypothetical protein V5O48_016177 [Marasmius crinis-equi]|uniref:EXPERA domain-containing protein n=1 Tax=Marasmius crinis-equi TaxID=585013 RepID=A0ABR3ESG0_9AGAR